MAFTIAHSPARHRPLVARSGNSALVLIAALFIAVLIADAVAVALAVPHIADLAALYTTAI